MKEDDEEVVGGEEIKEEDDWLRWCDWRRRSLVCAWC